MRHVLRGRRVIPVALFLPYTVTVNERTALAVIDRDYGSLEDFAIMVLSEKREALDDSLPLVKRAEAVGLPLPVFARILASPQFRAMLRVDLVNEAFGFEAEREHVERVVGVAKGERKRVMAPSGTFGDVDQAPGDVIAAGKYLNEMRGTAIEKSQQSAPSVVINIGGVQADDEEAVDVDVVPYRPQRAGGLPPPGARARFAKTTSDSLPDARVDAGLESLYGESAEEADADHEIAEKQADRDREEEPVDGGSESRVFSRRWPGRGIAPTRALSHSDD